MAGRKYELHADWEGAPLAEGSAREIAHGVHRLVASQLRRSGEWRFIVQEVPRKGVKAAPDTVRWRGAIEGTVTPQGALSSVEVGHLTHDDDWGKDVLDTYSQEGHQIINKPIPLRDMVKQTTAERYREWERRGAEASALADTVTNALRNRDVLANERMAEVASELTATGSPAEYEPFDVDDNFVRAWWYASPEQYERHFRSLVADENRTRVEKAHSLNSTSQWYRGYVELPDGKYRVRRISREEVDGMLKSDAFAPPKRSVGKPTRRDFPTKKGI